jgi:hypothetical protein
MSTPLRWVLAIIAVAAGLYFIVTSQGGGLFGGTAGFWIHIVIGLVLIGIALLLRPK